MYIPKPFRADDPDQLLKIIEENSFGILITTNPLPQATHLPFLLERGCQGSGSLQAHMARANPQWQDFRSDQEILAIFQGPHAYISPNAYVTHPSVPTWNYVVVHVYGIPKLITEDPEIRQTMATMVDQQESDSDHPWTMDLPEDYMQGMIRGTVSFEIQITRLEGTFKLSQNRSAEDRAGVITYLQESGDANGLAIAQLMQDL